MSLRRPEVVKSKLLKNKTRDSEKSSCSDVSAGLRFFNRYMDDGSQFPINLSSTQTQEVQNAFGGQLTGAQQLQALHTALNQSLSKQSMGAGDLSGPLNGIQ